MLFLSHIDIYFTTTCWTCVPSRWPRVVIVRQMAQFDVVWLKYGCAAAADWDITQHNMSISICWEYLEWFETWQVFYVWFYMFACCIPFIITIYLYIIYKKQCILLSYHRFNKQKCKSFSKLYFISKVAPTLSFFSSKLYFVSKLYVHKKIKSEHKKKIVHIKTQICAHLVQNCPH